MKVLRCAEVERARTFDEVDRLPCRDRAVDGQKGVVGDLEGPASVRDIRHSREFEGIPLQTVKAAPAPSAKTPR